MSSQRPRIDTPTHGLDGAVRAAAFIALLLAVVGAFAPGRAGRLAAGSMVAFIVAVPLLRVLGLGIHWLRLGDRRFAVAAMGLLTIVAVGAVIASL
jgi:hypothetical protein